MADISGKNSGPLPMPVDSVLITGPSGIPHMSVAGFRERFTPVATDSCCEALNPGYFTY